MNLHSQTHYVTLNDGRKLAYCEHGDPKGAPIFFFHGWPGSRMRGVILDEAAKKLHARIISIDRPGIGASDFQENRKLLDWPDDVCNLADHLKIAKFSVLGVSGGGPYVAACAYKIPDRVKKAGIVVGLGPTHIKGAFDGVAWTGRIGWENYARFPVLTEISSLIWLVTSRYLPILHSPLYSFKSKADQELLATPAYKDFPQAMKEAFRQGIKGPATDLKLYCKDWGFRLEDIKVKTFLWYGNDDENVSLNMGKYYRDHIKGSELTVYPNEGHLLISNHKEEILFSLL